MFTTCSGITRLKYGILLAKTITVDRLSGLCPGDPLVSPEHHSSTSLLAASKCIQNENRYPDESTLFPKIVPKHHIPSSDLNIYSWTSGCFILSCPL